MYTALAIPLYFGISFSVAIFLFNLLECYFCRRLGIAVTGVTVLFEPGFRFFRFEKNNIEYRLGWLPVGSLIKNNLREDVLPDLFNGEKDFRIRKVKYYLFPSVMVLLLVTILLINNDISGFGTLADFFVASGKFVMGTFDFFHYNQSFSRLHGGNHFFLSLALILFLMLISEFFILMNGSFLKYLGYVLLFAFMAVYMVFAFKLLAGLSIRSLAIFYTACLVSSALLLVVSSLIIKNK